LGNYQVLSEFPGSEAADKLPAEVGQLIGLSKKGLKYIGAYPPEQ
jgi:hypothetical protein